MSKSFTVTMEEDLVNAVDKKAEEECRSRSNMVAHLCRIFLSRGAMHPAKNSRKKGPSK